MKGSESKMTAFMEGADKRYVIPVYQRKYDWRIDNCRQLYEDLKKIIRDRRESHFFGSIVSSVVPNGSKIEYHIIDGQQRLTTVSLLLLAIRNLVAQKKITPQEDRLDEQINQRFLISPWARPEDRIKLRPVKGDREALEKLFGDEEDYDRASNLTLNYQFFCETLLKERIPVDEIYAAVGKLEIISITLDAGDNAQLIFESLNSTGLALTEGDKIRNFILMGLPPQDQTEYYEKYWAKIESCTSNDVSGFVRDYLSIKQQVTPTINNVYRAFKTFAEDSSIQVEGLLNDLLRYARFFEKLQTCKSGMQEPKLDDCLYRMKRLEIVVTRPFLMEVMRLHQDGKLTTEDVLRVFLITENYLFRRNICEVPTNALNKIFLNLNREILRYDGSTDGYVEKFIYALMSKKESGRFPSDEEFTAALADKQVYLMRGKYKVYMFERFENYGTVETKDVYTHFDNNTYSIEHIMPQHLTPAWVAALGENYQEIYTTWLHRLANLTLTGYNPSLSNGTFLEKRDDAQGGYRASGLKMNQKIATKDAWGLRELEERSAEMVERAKEIWAYPQTSFVPAKREFDSCSLDDENADLTGQDIAKYRYLNVEQVVTSWTDMFEHVVKYLHQTDKSVLTNIAFNTSGSADLLAYVSDKASDLRTALKIDEDIYIEKNTSTAMKLSLLRRLFPLYGADPLDLIFYLRDKEMDKAADADRYDLRLRYWDYSLPMIQKKNAFSGVFGNSNHTTSNTLFGFFGVPGDSIACFANYVDAGVCLYLAGNDSIKNRAVYDTIFSHKEEIERELGTALAWEREAGVKNSKITATLGGVSITNEDDWAAMARFHADMSARFCEVLLPYVRDVGDEEKRLYHIAGLFREWMVSRKDVVAHLSRSNRTCTRFTTEAMSKILPDLQDAPSGWNSPNHYFYEIINRTGNSFYIQFSISSRNITDEFRAICNRIQDVYPAKVEKENWQWRTPFKTKTVQLPTDLDKDKIFALLDDSLSEVLAFESDLEQRLQIQQLQM